MKSKEVRQASFSTEGMNEISLNEARMLYLESKDNK